MLFLLSLLFCSVALEASQVALQKTNFTLKTSVEFKTEICFVTYELINNRSGAKETLIDQYRVNKGNKNFEWFGDSSFSSMCSDKERGNMLRILEKARGKFCEDLQINKGDVIEQEFHFNKADLPGEPDSPINEGKSSIGEETSRCVIQ